MDQTVVSGIGNIYSDEILWESNVHPERKTADISEKEMQDIYKSSKKILKKALEVKYGKDINLEPLDDTLEFQAQITAIKKFS